MAKKQLRYLTDPDPWMLAEDIPDCDPFFTQIWQSCFVNEIANPNGRAYNKLLAVFRGYHLWFYYGEKDSFQIGEHIARRIVETPAFAKRVNVGIVRWSDRLRVFANTVPEEHLERLSKRQLWNWYQRHDAIHTEYYQWGWIPVAADMFHDNLTNRLKQYLRTLTAERTVNEYLVSLTHPRQKSLIQIEHEDFLKLAVSVYRDTRQRKLFHDLYVTFEEREAMPFGLQTHTPEFEQALEERVNTIIGTIKQSILKKIEAHYRTYFYVKFMWIGKEGVHSFDHYLKELVKLIGTGVNPIRELGKVQNDFQLLQKKRQQLMRRLRIAPRWRQVFSEWGDFMVTKIYRRYAQIYAIYRMQPVLREIAQRLRLTLKDVRFMFKGEVKNALLHGKINRMALRQREKLAVYYFERNREVVFTGNLAKLLVKQTQRSIRSGVQEITGQVGCVGKAVGTVRVIIRPKDMVKMQKGDILVSIATDLDIVPAMKKAAAIVTEQGGVTSHAAIVARELGIPCVIGTKIATRVLKDGDRVEVDATRGIVKKL
ncbi:MAG: PEP-utilizing enzyme [Parcubacteria group bacterium]